MASQSKITAVWAYPPNTRHKIKAFAVIFVAVLLAPTVVLAQCRTIATSNAFTDVSAPRDCGSALRTGFLSADMRASVAESKRCEQSVGAQFFTIPAPEIVVSASVSIRGGEVQIVATPLSVLINAGARLKLTVTHRSQVLCSDERVIAQPSGLFIPTLIPATTGTLTCRAPFPAVRTENVQTDVTLIGWAEAYGGGTASVNVTAIVNGLAVDVCCEGVRTPPREGVVPLFSWFSPSRKDNFMTSQRNWAGCSGSSRSPDYRFVRLEGYVFDPDRTQPSGTVPLNSWWSSDRNDNQTTTRRSIISLFPSYSMFRKEGYVYPRLSSPVAGMIPFHRWSSPSRQDHWTTSQHGASGASESVLSPDYRFQLHEGFIFAP